MLNKLKEKIHLFIAHAKKKEEVLTYVYICKVDLQLKNGERVTYLTDNYYRDYHSFVRANKEFKCKTKSYPLSVVQSYSIIRLKDSQIEVPFDGVSNRYETDYVHKFIKNVAVLD